MYCVDIAITFDIEFDINGAFSPPFLRTPRGRDSLICLINGVDIGLGRVLQYLERFNLRATFFVEALQATWFGLEEMGSIARLLFEHGHEVQLHLHPVWLIFENPEWKLVVSQQSPETLTHDSLATLSPELAAKAVKGGLEIFRQWGLPEPSAVRTGNLIVEREIYRILAESGLKISSSVGLGLYLPKDRGIRIFSAPRYIDNVLEIPVSSYVGVNTLLHRKTKLATIIGTGRAELRHLVRKAMQDSAQFLVFLSHVSEFCSIDSDGMPVENCLTADKFFSLCSLIESTPEINAVTISELAKKTDSSYAEDVKITVPRLLSAARVFDRPSKGVA